MRKPDLKTASEAVLAFIAVSLGLCGAYLAQFLPWASIGEGILAIART